MLSREGIDGILHALSGAEFAEVFLERYVAYKIDLDHEQVLDVHIDEEEGIGIRAVAAGLVAYASTDDLTTSGLQETVDAVASTLRLAPASRIVRLSRRTGTQLGVHAPMEVALATNVEPLRRGVSGAFAGRDAVRAARASYYYAIQEVCVANSLDEYAADHRVLCSARLEVDAARGDSHHTAMGALGGSGERALVEDAALERLAEEVADRAVAFLEAPPPPAGVFPVVLAGTCSGALFHEACGHGLEADYVERGSSPFCARLGEAVASPLITLVDDGGYTGGYASAGIDDEGVPVQRTVLIDRGVLAAYLHNRRTARRHNCPPTGNGRRQGYHYLPLPRMTNTVLLPGTTPAEEVVASVARGIYVAQLGRGKTSPASGDLVFQLHEGYLIEKGRLTAPVRHGLIRGNGPRVLQSIDLVSNDAPAMLGLGYCYKHDQTVTVGFGHPTIRIPRLLVG